MKRPNWGLALALTLVFISGVILGAIGHRGYHRRHPAPPAAPKGPDDFKREYVSEMKSRLKLSDDQVERLGHILDETRARFKALRDTLRPQMKVIQDQQVEEINSLLTAAQQKEYALMRKEREEKKKAEEAKQKAEEDAKKAAESKK